MIMSTEPAPGTPSGASFAMRGKQAAARVDTKDQLRQMADELKVRPDWHEPDEQLVTAVVHGSDFDNAGFWGRDSRGELITFGRNHQELWVELFRDHQPVAEINLATLLAWATGFED
jgi:hypothetical protein